MSNGLLGESFLERECSIENNWCHFLILLFALLKLGEDKVVYFRFLEPHIICIFFS